MTPNSSIISIAGLENKSMSDKGRTTAGTPLRLRQFETLNSRTLNYDHIYIEQQQNSNDEEMMDSWKIQKKKKRQRFNKKVTFRDEAKKG